MSLQAILERIRASGDAQIQEIEINTQSEINAVLKQAEIEARQIEENSCAAASAPAFLERARILHQARLESLRTIGNVRENLVDSAISRVRERLTSIRSDSVYPSVLRMMIQEAMAALVSGGNEETHLIADPRDRILLKEILESLNLNLDVRYELNCCGGLIAKSEDGRVVVINTLESRLERATGFLRSYLAALFEEDRLESDPKSIIETIKV